MESPSVIIKLLQRLNLTDSLFPWSIESINKIKEYEELIQLSPIVVITRDYPELHPPGIEFNDAQRKFCGYIIISQKHLNTYGDDWITASDIHSYWVEILLLSIVKHLEVSGMPAHNWTYPLDRIRAYLSNQDVPFSYIWLIFCAIRRLVKLRDIYTAWYPDLIYVHALNKIQFLEGDDIIFKEFLGKEYRNMMRFLLICLFDLIKDFPPPAGNILVQLKNHLLKCDTVSKIKEFLGKLYMQLLMITINSFF